MSEIRELKSIDFGRALRRSQRARLAAGKVESGADVTALRRFVGLDRADFARAIGVSARTVQGWESGRTRPVGAELALVRIAARHPRAVRDNVASAA